TGEINSHFTVEGVAVEVQTAAHQQLDLISVNVQSDLIKDGRLKVRVRYPYPTAQFLDEGTYWEEHNNHTSEIVAFDNNGAIVNHSLQGTEYHTGLRWDNGTIEKTTTPHY